MTGVLLCLKRSILTKICAKSESEVAGMERYDEEEEKAKEEYEKHKCKTCVYAKWQGIYIVSCLFPRCVRLSEFDEKNVEKLPSVIELNE